LIELVYQLSPHMTETYIIIYWSTSIYLKSRIIFGQNCYLQ